MQPYPLRFAIAGTAVLGLVAVVGCGGTGAGPAGAASSPPPAVEAVPARTGTLPLVERLSGVTRAANQVELRPEIAGIVEAVEVRSGATVRRGDLLVRLRDDYQREQLTQAEASVRLAEASRRAAEARVAELESRVVRARALAADELISVQELETLEAQLATSEAATAEERARVEQTRAVAAERRVAIERMTVRAPIDGRVGRRNVEVGMRVDPGTLLFVIGDPSRLIVEVPLTEAMLGYLRVGQPARILAPGPRGRTPIEVELSRISPFLREGSFSTVGEIDVANGDGKLSPGMFVPVEVRYGETENATLVPTAALWEEPSSGEWYVFVLSREDVEAAAPSGASGLSDEALPFERRGVEVVAEGRSSLGIAGVDPGEWVVTVGQHLLADEGVERARVRPTTWERVESLQRLQREDLLERFLARQRRVARERGAAPVPDEEYVGAAAGSSP